MTDAAIGVAAARAGGGVGLRRGLLLAALVAGAAGGALAANSGETAAAVARAGGELTRLLRLMAVLKSAMAAGAVAAVWWRLSCLAAPLRLGAYLLAAAAMAAGPGLIWGMAHLGWGALLLHGGLVAALVVLWRDPASVAMVGEAVARRRRSLAGVPALHRGGGSGKASTPPV